MKKQTQGMRILTALFAALLCTLFAGKAHAMIVGESGTAFNLTAKAGHISTGDGSSVYAWGYANGAGPMQYPGVTLIVPEGAAITVNLANELEVPVSIVFPGHEDVVATGGEKGLVTQEAAPLGGTVSYTFTAAEPGTYLYHSGTRPELQIEMGLVGAIIVRPTGFDMMAPQAYEHADSAYDREFLFLLTEMDPRIHDLVELQGVAALDSTNLFGDYFPVLWFINGRNAPDTMLAASVPWLPSQPYNCMPMMYPGERMLMRMVAAGRDQHPFHHHGNHSRIIAKDGRLLSSAPGAGADLSYEVFTIPVVPGGTFDAIFQWTGEQLGWDIYGTDALGPEFAHTCNDGGNGFDPVTFEYCPDHGKPLPVLLPNNLEMAFGGMWSGSPYLGHLSELPPGEGGLNPLGGYSYMWHSHTEKEMVNYDIFPGGMMTMLMIIPPGAPMPMM
jgi:hypothetical protein